MNTTTEIAKTSNLDGNVAGGSSGALLILLAQSLPPDSGLAQILLYSSPFIGVGISTFWKWSKARLDEYLTDRKFKIYISECKDFIEKSLNDPNLSEERKEELKKQYDQLNQLTTNVHFDKIKSIKFEKEYSTLIDTLNEVAEESQANSNGKKKELETEKTTPNRVDGLD